jgi:predicted nucleic acid-binding protein
MVVDPHEKSFMTATLFVDTNVLVYSRDAREPAKMSRARQWLEYLWREQLGRTSVQVLTEYYNVMTRKMRPAVTQQKAWDSVDAFFVWSPQPVDRALLERGRAVEERYELSWWDSLVVAAAQLQACSVLLTEDLQDGCTYGTVTVLNPFNTGVAEARASYASAPVAVRRYRSRGRPKRAA